MILRFVETLLVIEKELSCSLRIVLTKITCKHARTRAGARARELTARPSLSGGRSVNCVGVASLPSLSRFDIVRLAASEQRETMVVFTTHTQVQGKWLPRCAWRATGSVLYQHDHDKINCERRRERLQRTPSCVCDRQLDQASTISARASEGQCLHGHEMIESSRGRFTREREKENKHRFKVSVFPVLR